MKQSHKIGSILKLLRWGGVSFFLLFACVSHAQTVEIPDANFRNYLLDRIPSAFNDTEELILSEAKNYDEDISCDGLGIRNLSGIEYFHNVTLINCSDNQLTVLPLLDSLINLRQFWVLNNQISALPELNGLISLRTLNVKNNQLDVIPDIDLLTEIREFDCSGNRLSSLPELNSLSNLINLYCYNNVLTSFPPIFNLTKIQVFDIHNNELQELPEFASFINLEEVSLSNNHFTFADILPLTIDHQPFDTIFHFHPQKEIIHNISLNLKRGETIRFDIEIDQSQPDLLYSWYRNGIVIDSTDNPIFNRENVSEADSGEYTCFITSSNPLLSGFRLMVIGLEVEIATCLFISSIEYSIVKNECLDGATLVITQENVMQDENDFVKEYALFSTLDNTLSYEIVGSDSFENILPGSYTLTIKDTNNCQSTLHDYIRVNTPSSCTQSFTPNGDGLEDTFLIEQNGDVKIYNKNGHEVNAFQGPSNWDGTDAEGIVVPTGIYIIIIDESYHQEVVVLN